MWHLDEGTLHALLDGTLDNAEMRQIQAHLGTCTSCGSRLAEVKEVRAEADRLVTILEPPRAAGPPRPPFPPPPATEPWSSPVLLIPDPADDATRHQRRMRALGWAAAIAVAAGAGYFANDIRRQNDLQQTRLRELEEIDTRAAAAPTSRVPATVSPEEEAPSPRLPAPPVNQQPVESLRPEPTPPARPELAQRAVPEPTTPPANAASTDTVPVAESLVEERLDEEGLDEDAQRLRDAAATAELDRRRVARERAAAATAALDAQRRAEERERARAQAARTGAGAGAAPAVRPIEERARIYLRIGLDEAARQLGGPMHVIEGMSPELVGLAQGHLSTGMDAARPVVRVVYRDAIGRLVFLDQQRIRGGQDTGPSSARRWTIGDVLVHLHGEPPDNALRNLAPRVR